jgi:hypothetical protein
MDQLTQVTRREQKNRLADCRYLRHLQEVVHLSNSFVWITNLFGTFQKWQSRQKGAVRNLVKPGFGRFW